MRKRLFALLLTLAMILALLIVPVGAAEIADSGSCGDDVSWELDRDGVLTITGTGPMTNYDEEDYPWLESDPAVTSIVIGEGVTTVGDYAFAGCVALKSVTLPETLRYIGGGSFVYCIALESIAIPAGVEYVEVGAFVQCEALEQVTLPEAITYVAPNAFRLCSSLQSIVIPEGVTYVDTGAFAGCSALAEVSLPASLNSVEQDAFSDCGSLTDVYYAGSESQWSAVEIFAGNTPLENAALHCAQPDLAITAQPEDFTGTVGGTAFFTVEATGADLAYQWQYKDAGGEWTDSKSTTSEATCKITAARDGRQYRCIVTGSGETTVSDAATLTVMPDITIQPEDFAGAVGDTAVFTVKATGPSLTYQWQYRDVGGDWINSKSTTNAATCKITAARSGRQYRCIVTAGNGLSVFSETAELLLQPSELVITAQPEDYTGAAGETATFLVEASGNGLAYRWQYSDDNGSSWINSTTNTTAVATCKITAARDGRLYRCVVSDAFGNTVTSEMAKLVVKAPIVITAQPEDYTGAVGETAVFNVTAAGTDLSYQWQYKDVGGKWKTSKSTTDTATCKISADRDGRMYRCIVTDGAGNRLTSASATLTVH